MTVCAVPAVAQPAPQAKPATPEELLTYSFMGGVSVCNSVKNSFTDYDKAMANAVVMTSTVIYNKHSSKIIDPSGKTVSLEPQQLESGVVIQTFGQIERICAKDFEGVSKTQFEAQKKLIESALKNSQQQK